MATRVDWSALRQLAVDSEFAVFGADAEYLPLGGTPLAVVVVRRKGVDRYEAQGQVLTVDPRTLDSVRISEIATSKRGDRITIGAETLEVDEVEKDDGFVRKLVMRPWPA